jgi:DNA invertase Pin-like site-specific DNA recombinase
MEEIETNKTIGYIRVSSIQQNYESQEADLLRWANKEEIHIKLVSEKISSHKKLYEREIVKTIESLRAGDTLVVTEMTRIGRNIQEILSIIQLIKEAGARLVLVRNNITVDAGSTDIASKIFLTVIALMAEVERDLISERTQSAMNGLKQKVLNGEIRPDGTPYKLGRPRGAGKSRLDGKGDIIAELTKLGLSEVKIARNLGVSRMALRNWKEKHTGRD